MLHFHLIFIFKPCDTDKARLGLAVSGALGATSGGLFSSFFFLNKILFYIGREKDGDDRREEKKMVVGAEASRSI